MASFPQASPPTPCALLYPPPYAPHALPISFVSILPPAQYWVRSTDHSAPGCAAFSIPLLLRIVTAFIPHYVASFWSRQQSLNFSNWKLSTSSMLLSVGLDYFLWAFFVFDISFRTVSFTNMWPHCTAWHNSRAIFASTYGMFRMNGFVRLRCELWIQILKLF
jgi:hypothetical protein